MNPRWTLVALVGAVGLLWIPSFASSQGQPAKDSPLAIRGKSLIAANELKWTPLPGIEGAQQALIVGDPAKEAHRAFFKYPVGLKSPPHSHSFGDRGVIVSGTLGLALEGAPRKTLGPGSFFSIGAGIEHVTTVEGDAPCVFYLEREGPFDVVVAQDGSAKRK